MGGLNSGRPCVTWGRDKPIVEDSSILSVFALQKAGALVNGASGVYRFESNSLSYWMHGDVLTVEYKTRGQVVTEHITIGSISLYWRHGTSKRCFICPKCERRSYKLYITPKYLRPLCRLCNDMVYELQTHHHGGLIYMLWQGVQRERRYEARYKARARKHTNTHLYTRK